MALLWFSRTIEKFNGLNVSVEGKENIFSVQWQ